MCISILPACMSAWHMHSECLQKLEDIRSPETGARESCEPLCGCLELDPGPLEEQQLILTTDPSL